jgi:hypothetical protein
LRPDSFPRMDDALFQILQTSDSYAVHLVLCVPQKESKSTGIKSDDIAGQATANKYRT